MAQVINKILPKWPKKLQSEIDLDIGEKMNTALGSMVNF